MEINKTKKEGYMDKMGCGDGCDCENKMDKRDELTYEEMCELQKINKEEYYAIMGQLYKNDLGMYWYYHFRSYHSEEVARAIGKRTGETEEQCQERIRNIPSADGKGGKIWDQVMREQAESQRQYYIKRNKEIRFKKVWWKEKWNNGRKTIGWLGIIGALLVIKLSEKIIGKKQLIVGQVPTLP